MLVGMKSQCVGNLIMTSNTIMMTTSVVGMPEEFRMFNNVSNARDYVRSRAGRGLLITEDRVIVSKDRTVKIVVTGVDVKELLNDLLGEE
jgi:hypothetical protein